MGARETVSDSAKILLFGKANEQTCSLVEQLRQRQDVEITETLEAGLQRLRADDVSGLFLLGNHFAAFDGLLEAGGLLEQMPDGIALLSPKLEILWCNARFEEMSGQSAALLGQKFYDAFGTPEITGPDYCPFHTAVGLGKAARSTLHVGEKDYFSVDVKPLFLHDNVLQDHPENQNTETQDIENDPNLLLVIVRDISDDVLQRQKLNAIYQAGLQLGDLSPEEILEMPFSDRIELLKSRVLHYTKDLLEFETVEIRLIDRTTKRLTPLLAAGMEPDAEKRKLFAKPELNGVTGFVAVSGKSYLCEDTENDPLYLPGAKGTRSSLTVPLSFHDQILGTFNVESPHPGAFNNDDLQFLELFSREVAMALNTLELLAVEKAISTTENTERILREIANPVDEILNDAAWVLERYIGHDPNVVDRLHNILKHTRAIKRHIQETNEDVIPEAQRQSLPPRPIRPKLLNKRILVVDEDDTVRQAAHELLEKVGCVVETAHNGDEACLMIRRFDYNAVIADIRLPDMSGFDCFQKIKELKSTLPVILMTGFGYDPKHSIVKAREAGLQSVLYKPFRRDQLLTEVEKAVEGTDENNG